MTGLVRKAAVLAACGVLFGAAAAFAGVPSPANSTIPARINLVGVNASALPDSVPQFAKVSVTVRDLANNPIANSSVVLDFNGDASDVRFGDTQPYLGVTANCGTRTVSKLTDATGVASFVVVGGGKAIVGAPHAPLAGKIYADGVLLGSLAVGIYDQDGVSGVAIPDLSRWAADFFGGTSPERSDFDNVSGVQVPDLSVWASTFFAGQSTASAATYCP
jgi:hypothetical protein